MTVKIEAAVYIDVDEMEIIAELADEKGLDDDEICKISVYDEDVENRVLAEAERTFSNIASRTSDFERYEIIGKEIY